MDSQVSFVVREPRLVVVHQTWELYDSCATCGVPLYTIRPMGADLVYNTHMAKIPPLEEGDRMIKCTDPYYQMILVHHA